MKSEKEVMGMIAQLQDFIDNYKEDKIPQYWSNKDCAEKILERLLYVVDRCPTCGQEFK